VTLKCQFYESGQNYCGYLLVAACHYLYLNNTVNGIYKWAVE